MKISIQEIVQKAADEVLDNVKIGNTPFREWVDNINNVYANKKCNLTSCRYNADGKCTNDEKRKECVEVSEKVLCIDKKTFRKIDNVKHIGDDDDKPIETAFGVDISQKAVEQYAETHLGRKPRNYQEFSSARNAKIIEESKEL